MEQMRKFLVLLLVLAYSGQVLAALALPCPKMAHPTAAAGMAGMVHAGHHMAADPDTAPAAVTPAAGNCCDGGLCNMNHCQLAAALPPSVISGGALHVARHVQAADSPSPLQVIATLYRPPISR